MIPARLVVVVGFEDEEEGKEEMPLTVTETVSMEPEPLGPSITEVDSVRRSLFVGRGRGRVVVVLGSMGVLTSHGMGVRAAPPTKSSSSSSLWASGSEVEVGLVEGEDVPFGRRPFARVLEGEEMEGRGKRDNGLETEMTRSRARR